MRINKQTIIPISIFVLTIGFGVGLLYTVTKVGSPDQPVVPSVPEESSARTPVCELAETIIIKDPTHLECVQEACIEVDGEEVDTCSSDEDCVEEEPSHLVCTNMACVSVDGDGENECSESEDCYRYTCVGESCDKVEGDGSDTCSSDSDCGDDPTHLVCTNMACVTVEGDGSNECTNSSDCYYYTCVNESCDKVAGNEASSCSTDSDCEENEVQETRLVCRNQACVTVHGSGSDECAQNSDCLIAVEKVEETQEKPVVPKTGVNTIFMYLLLGVSLIAGGTFLIGRKRN